MILARCTREPDARPAPGWKDWPLPAGRLVLLGEPERSDGGTLLYPAEWVGVDGARDPDAALLPGWLAAGEWEEVRG